MRIKVLGAGVGAAYYLPNKEINKYPPAFLVEIDEVTKLLFECSQGVNERLEMMNVDYASIHHVAISHPHPDHCVPIPYLQSVYLKGYWGGEQFKNNELHIYGPNGLTDNFQKLWDIYVPDKAGKYLDWPTIHLHGMSHGDQTYTIGNAKLSARKVFHAYGKCDAVSYRLQTPEITIAYSGDTGDCDAIREIAQDADLFICEASARVGDFDFAKSYGHLTPYQAGEIAKQGNVKRVILFHFTGQDDDDAMIADVRKTGFTGDVSTGKDFQEITV